MSETDLHTLHKRIMEISDPLNHVRREVRRLESEHEAIKNDALMSGAMPQEFKVVHLFRRSGLATALC